MQKVKKTIKFIQFALGLAIIPLLFIQAPDMPQEVNTTTIPVVREMTKEEKKLFDIKKPMTDKEKIAKNVCFSKGLDQDFCWKDLIAIATKETHLNTEAIGDNGKSFGAYQIHLGYHPDITKQQAKDFKWSTDWVLTRLMSKGYPKLRSDSIRSHNGSTNNPVTLKYFKDVNEIASK
jgi:hypothetical protein